jgi:hypothetical protein
MSSANSTPITTTNPNVSPIISISTPVPNLNSFQTTAVQANNVSTQSLSVSSTATTNGITDNQTIDCQNLVISNTASFSGTVTSNSSCLATSAYVNTQINNLLGSSVPTLLSTIKEIDSAINNDPNFSTTMTTQLATKAGLSSSNTFSSLNSFTNGISTNTLSLNGTDLNTRLTTDETNIGLKATDTLVIHNTGNETINGIKTFVTSPVVPTQSANNNSTNVASTAYVDTMINNLIAGAPSTLNTLNSIATLLQTDTNSITSITNNMVDLSSNQSVGGIKTFTSSPQVPTKSQGDNGVNCASTAYVDTGLATKLNVSNPTITGTLTSPTIVLNGNNLQTSLNGKQATLTYDSAPTSSSNNVVTSGVIYTSLQNYVPLSGSTTVSNNLTLSGNVNHTGQLAINDLIENISTATVSSNALSISYTSNNAIIYITPSSSNNISLTLTNIPTSYSNANINLTFIINTSSYKQYINSITINSTSYTMKASGGLSNISINSSANIVIQNINILFLSGSISQVLTSVNSWF